MKKKTRNTHIYGVTARPAWPLNVRNKTGSPKWVNGDPLQTRYKTTEDTINLAVFFSRFKDTPRPGLFVFYFELGAVLASRMSGSVPYLYLGYNLLRGAGSKILN